MSKKAKNLEFSANFSETFVRKKWEASRMIDAPDFEYNLRQIIIMARIRSCLTQSEVANRMKVTQGMISEYEAGNSNPTIYFIQRFAEAVEIEIKMKSEKIACCTHRPNEL